MSAYSFGQAIGVAAARKKKPPKAHPFTPFAAPARPPAGYYDPALDSQEGAATRGLQDLTADTATAGTRANDDLLLGQNRVNEQFGNALADAALARDRGTQDFNTQTGERTRQYGILGNNQGQSANAAGLSGGGALAQASQKRQANQGREQGLADQSYQRFLTDNQTSTDRLTQGKGNALADLALGYQRGGEDRGTALARGQRENTQFGLDVGAQRNYQAASLGYEAPTRPSNEGTRSGITYHRLGGGQFKLADGSIISHDELLRRIKKAQGAGA